MIYRSSRLALLVIASWANLAGVSWASDLRRSAIVRAVEAARPAVVNIHGEKSLTPAEAAAARLEADRRVNGMGTGILLDPRGYIITNFHVVDGVQRIEVTLSTGETFVARLIARDPATDMALVKVDASRSLPVINVGTSADLMTGESVIAIGNAFGYEHTVTQGIISALHRTVEVGEGLRYEDLIQTDASINPGNSGGPLLNIDGELIGVNVAVRAGAQGIGFAIPSDRVMQIAADLMSIRRLKNTWHGLVCDAAPREPRRGLTVRKVLPNSPAAAAGLQPDDVILEVSQHKVARPLDLERALLGHQAGERISIVVARGAGQHSYVLALAEAPAPAADDAVWEVLGLRLRPVPPGQFEQYRTHYNGGLSVVAVRSDGPAARQGIRTGDVLVGMHIWETLSLENVQYIINREDFAELEPVKFYILRGKETLYGHLSTPGRLQR